MTFRQRTQLASPARLAPVLTLAAIGCSLIVPLDYVGGAGASASGGNAGNPPIEGTGGAQGGSGGQTGLGGSAAVGGDGAVGAVGGTDATGGAEGGTDNGGAPGGSGMAGDDNGGDGASPGQGGALGGSSGSAGAGAAGTAGLDGGTSGGPPLGGRGGRGGMGGVGGVSGVAGAAGTGGCGNVDLTTDHENCGSCENACESSAECIDSYCASSPCDGVCASFSSTTLSPGQGYKRENIGTGEVCVEVSGYAPANDPPSLVCWNFGAPTTTVELNGVTIPCDGVGHDFDAPLRVGGYCVRVSPGPSQYRGFEFPD